MTALELVKKVVIRGTKANGKRCQKEVWKFKRNLDLSSHQLTSIDLSSVSHCPKVRKIYLDNNQLSSMDLSPLADCPNLLVINLSSNQLSSIDFSPLAQIPTLRRLHLYNNQLSSVDLSPLANCSNLRVLSLTENQLASVDLTPIARCPKLWRLGLDASTTIYWTSDSFDERSLPPGLHNYREIIQQAYQQYLSRTEEAKTVSEAGSN